jgi:hypothetical protein
VIVGFEQLLSGWWGRKKIGRLRVPICLPCSLEAMVDEREEDQRRGLALWHRAPGWQRCRCEGCGRQLRIWRRYHYRPLPFIDRVCCADCERKAVNRWQNERRRVRHKETICLQCGETFVPMRSHAEICSNRCRQARFRALRR